MRKYAKSKSIRAIIARIRESANSGKLSQKQKDAAEQAVKALTHAIDVGDKTAAMKAVNSLCRVFVEE